MKELFGTGVALVTPFNDKGNIDYKGLKKLLEHTAKGGVDYFVVMGTTGESATLNKEEKAAVLDFVKKNNSKKLPIVYGIGGNNTALVIEEIRKTNLRGVSAILSVSPYYNKPSQEGIYRHYEAMADASPLPIILYNVPGRTSSNISAETCLRLASHSNIIGVKEASGNIEQAMLIAQSKPKDFMLISGDDVLTLAMYSIGGVGVISVLANAYPEVFKSIKNHTLTGNYKKAAAEAFKLLAINPFMYEEGNPAGVKQLLSELNICSPGVRLPLVPASKGLSKKIAITHKALKKG